jgi:hypothetical protein
MWKQLSQCWKLLICFFYGFHSKSAIIIILSIWKDSEEKSEELSRFTARTNTVSVRTCLKKKPICSFLDMS